MISSPPGARRYGRSAGRCRSSSRTRTRRSTRGRRSATASPRGSGPTACPARQRSDRVDEVLDAGRARAVPRPALSASVLRRPAPADRHRPGPGRGAPLPRRRRAGVGPRRLDPVPDPEPAPRPAAASSTSRSCSWPTTWPWSSTCATGSRSCTSGRIVEIGTRDEVFADPQHPYTQALLSAIPIPDPDRPRQRIRLEGELPSPLNPPPGCRFHPRCPIAVMGEGICDELEPELLPVGRQPDPPRRLPPAHRMRSRTASARWPSAGRSHRGQGRRRTWHRIAVLSASSSMVRQ